MAIYLYEALMSNGKTIKGKIQAEAFDEAVEGVKELGYFITGIKIQKQNRLVRMFKRKFPDEYEKHIRKDDFKRKLLHWLEPFPRKVFIVAFLLGLIIGFLLRQNL